MANFDQSLKFEKREKVVAKFYVQENGVHKNSEKTLVVIRMLKVYHFPRESLLIPWENRLSIRTGCREEESPRGSLTWSRLGVSTWVTVQNPRDRAQFNDNFPSSNFMHYCITDKTLFFCKNKLVTKNSVQTIKFKCSNCQFPFKVRNIKTKEKLLNSTFNKMYNQI